MRQIEKMPTNKKDSKLALLSLKTIHETCLSPGAPTPYMDPPPPETRQT